MNWRNFKFWTELVHIRFIMEEFAEDASRKKMLEFLPCDFWRTGFARKFVDRTNNRNKESSPGNNRGALNRRGEWNNRFWRKVWLLVWHGQDFKLLTPTPCTVPEGDIGVARRRPREGKPRPGKGRMGWQNETMRRNVEARWHVTGKLTGGRINYWIPVRISASYLFLFGWYFFTLIAFSSSFSLSISLETHLFSCLRLLWSPPPPPLRSNQGIHRFEYYCGWIPTPRM